MANSRSPKDEVNATTRVARKARARAEEAMKNAGLHVEDNGHTVVVFMKGTEAVSPRKADVELDDLEVSDPETESSGDRAVITRPIDPNQPWAEWPDPDIIPTNLGDLSIGIDGDQLTLIAGEDGEEELLGIANTNALQQLGWVAKFPVEFVQRLSPETQVQVINERLDDTPDKDLAVILENGVFTNLVKGDRGIPPTKEVAQVAYDALRGVYGDKHIEVATADHGDGKMHLRLMTHQQKPVTRRKGDVLQMGVDIRQDYGLGLELSLYVNRLVCVNGMTAENREFAWQVRSETTVDHQLAWISTGIGEVVGAFENIVKRSKEMSEIHISGDIEEIIRRYAKAMKFPARYIGRVIEAYNLEPDPTQWGILNAFTRVASHTLSGRSQHEIQRAAGQWVQEFDMCNVRLPRPVAVSLGAEVIPD